MRNIIFNIIVVIGIIIGGYAIYNYSIWIGIIYTVIVALSIWYTIKELSGNASSFILGILFVLTISLPMWIVKKIRIKRNRY